MKKPIILTFTIAFSLVISFIYSFNKNAPSLNKAINCYAQVNYNYVDVDVDVELQGQIRSGIYFELFQGKGRVDYSAVISVGNKKYTVKRNAEVSYIDRDPTVYSLKTVKLNIMQVDDTPPDIGNKYLYPYLTHEGGMFNLGVHSNANNGYVFSTTATPQFLCKKL